MKNYTTKSVERTFRNISLISYLFIMLSGQMIQLPLIFWLLYNCFQFGNFDQLYAILGLVGIALNVFTIKRNLIVLMVSFVCMIIPLLSRFYAVPLVEFSYLTFQVPFIIFVLANLISILLVFLINIRNRKNSVH